MTEGVSLQISFAPPDVRHAVHVLPHQLRAVGQQVDEILLVLDAVKSPSKRFNANWETTIVEMRSLLESTARNLRIARVVEVDYGQATMQDVTHRFFDRSRIPGKDLRGGPFYAYFFGLTIAAHRHVFHLDSDMLLGGGSKSWVSEAVTLLRARAEVLCTCPLAGPPARDGALRDQDAYAPAEERPCTFRFRDFTSRVFLCDLERLGSPLHTIPLAHGVPLWARGRALLTRRSTYALPEQLITNMMREHGLVRVDLLGQPPGLWTLHAADRSEQFIQALPDIIDGVERGEITAAQLGRYDVHPSMTSEGHVISA